MCHNASRQFIKILGEEIETFVLACYSYISSSAIRREKLRIIFERANVKFKHLKTHAKTRWATLGPAISRILYSWPMLKKFFEEENSTNTQQNNTVRFKLIIKMIFEEETKTLIQLYFAERVLKHFSRTIHELEKDSASVIDSTFLIDELRMLLDTEEDDVFNNGPISEGAVLLDGRQISDYLSGSCEEDQLKAVNKAMEYLEANFGKKSSATERKLLTPLRLLENEGFKFPSFAEIDKIAAAFLPNYDRLRLMDEWYILKQNWRPAETEDDLAPFKSSSTAEKWVQILTTFKECSEIRKLISFLLSIPTSSASAERVFSRMNFKARKERSNLSVEMLKSELIITSNAKRMTTMDFFDMIRNDSAFLKAIGGAQKYKGPVQFGVQNERSEENTGDNLESFENTALDDNDIDEIMELSRAYDNLETQENTDQDDDETAREYAVFRYPDEFYSDE